MDGMAEPGAHHHPPRTFRARFITLFLLWRLRKPRHGYSLLKDVAALGVTPMGNSSIYALLSKLEKRGMIKGEYERRGRRMRKLYTTTPQGMALLSHVKKKLEKSLLKEFLRDIMV